jgi:DNA-directed RNA polymerase subunit RPC12/RpoP
MTDRDGHHEYACVQCGHPLVFAADHDPYAASGEFKKKVRYLCGLLGHRVHRVTSRDGYVEHACHCGHSFLKDEGPRNVIRHPLICVAAGHFVQYIDSRAGYAEYVCRNCGHPFCFAESEAR